jgi:hypothetical protein
VIIFLFPAYDCHVPQSTFDRLPPFSNPPFTLDDLLKGKPRLNPPKPPPSLSDEEMQALIDYIKCINEKNESGN